jgi:hypothetical protein
MSLPRPQALFNSEYTSKDKTPVRTGPLIEAPLGCDLSSKLR